ncbi:MAG: HEAT repeat domain-containing protein [Bacteroidales bacterium]|nr:HEAT repeat domain-containing protein [Bacteroidales bacterium]
MRNSLLLILFLSLTSFDSAVSFHEKKTDILMADTIQSKSNDAIVANDTININYKAKATVRKFLVFRGDSPWLRQVTYFGRSFALVNALLLVISLSIVTMIILLIIILLNRTSMEKQEKLRQYLMEKYQGLIIDYLFGETKPEELLSIASDSYRRQLLIDQIIDVSINLKGDTGEKLVSLYKHLNLDKDSVSRAYSKKWHIKIKGFRELAFMNVKDANDAIYETLNSKNEILRMEAQIALVRLSDNDQFGFLSHLTRPFSLWEQITLHDLIVHHKIEVPQFKLWLTSKNDTVVMFALRMIREFRQSVPEEEIKTALLHPSPSVRCLAVQVVGDLGMSSTLETLKHMYKSQDYNICLEIVRSMGKMPDVSMIGFLKLVLDKEDDVQLQIEATKAIENMGEEGVKALVKIMKSEYKNYNIIVRHVLDRRIY